MPEILYHISSWKVGSLFSARIALALALHCGWDGQCIANGKAMRAGEKLLSGSYTKQA
ncbi:MAG: hypothetical protein RBS43_06355 [Candidatus Cloacimonas sp.]|nr:hypothetical protein [Candidatus Cloacimonas sp.]